MAGTIRIKRSIAAVLALVLALACPAGALSAGAVGPAEGEDYSQAEHWAYYAIGEDKEADLFLICPTVDMKDEFNMSMEDEETKGSFLGALNMERGIYEDRKSVV